MAQLEEEFSRGNFAAVRALAPGASTLEAPWPTRANALVEMTRTDPHAWWVGAGAVFVVLLVAALTLTAG